MPAVIFRKILCAYDGSEHAFEAFKLALALAEQNSSELHIVSVGEIELPPQFIQDIHEEKASAERRLRALLFRARSLTAESKVRLNSHVLAGNPVRVIVTLASELNAELLVIGTRGHSALFELLVGSRAGQIVQLALCPVLAVKHIRKGRRLKSGFKRWFGSHRPAQQSIVRGGRTQLPPAAAPAVILRSPATTRSVRIGAAASSFVSRLCRGASCLG